jgi:formylglycine-generating enzyme required for sulfatase activity
VIPEVSVRVGIAAFLAWAAAAVPALAQEVREEKIPIPGTPLAVTIVRVPGGRVTMGFDGGARREVELRPFWMGKFEVTWAEFDAFFESEQSNVERLKVDGITRPTKAKSYFGQVGLPNHFLEARRPVINVRWHGAAAFCDWLARQTGRRFRLPTEAEWEHACRAGMGGDLEAQAWHAGNSGERTHVVGEKKADAIGLHDLLGNVWEYCLEPMNPPEYGPVLRGGAWNTPASELGPAARQGVLKEWYEADPNRPRSSWWLTNVHTQGFRVVLVDEGAEAAAVREYARKIEVKVLGFEDVPQSKRPALGSHAVRVWGEVRNVGDRSLDELDLTVYYLDPKGQPHLLDVIGADKEGRATFGRCWPVLVSSAHDGPHAKPLKPGETRAFVVEFPQTSDPEDYVAYDKFGARVSGLRFSPAP